MKYSYVALSFCFIPLLANAQDSIRQEGDKSISFSFDGFAVESYKLGIGGKYWARNNIAYTGSINFGKSKVEDSTNNSGTITSERNESDYYAISLGVERHINNSTKVSPYIGGEVQYSETKLTPFQALDTKQKTYGVNALLGVEYYFNQEISLGAEYSFGYSKSKYEATSTSYRQEATTKNLSFGSSKLILSFYF